MSKTISISNKRIDVEISTMGAELMSIKKNGKEILWDGNPAFWANRAPIMFPICGRLKEDKFLFEGKEYYLSKHGFAKLLEFEVEKKGVDFATFLLKSNKETLEKYPFEFEFRVTFTLSENTLVIDYNVKNIDTKTMYYSVGAHEAYACPDGIEAYSIVFEKEEDFATTLLNGSFLKKETLTIAEKSRELRLNDKYFENDALVFTSIKSRKAALKNLKTDEIVLEVDFNGFDYLLLWKKLGAAYICIEPWCGIPDYEDGDFDITKKTGIIKLLPNDVCNRRHSLNF